MLARLFCNNNILTDGSEINKPMVSHGFVNLLNLYCFNTGFIVLPKFAVLEYLLFRKHDSPYFCSAEL